MTPVVNASRAERQVLATTIGIVAGTYAAKGITGYVGATGTRLSSNQTKYASHGGGMVAGMAAGSPMCGWAPAGCDRDAPGPGAVLDGPENVQSLFMPPDG